MEAYRVALLMTLGGMVARMRLEIQRRRRAEARVRAVIDEVDRRVCQRTQELGAANDLKDRFLATISHELRTPLNAIIGWAHVLKEGVVSPSQMTHAIEAIDRNAHAQARLVENLLDVSSMMQGQLVLTRAPVDFRAVLQDEIAEMQRLFEARGLELRCRRTPQPVCVLGDEARLRQVVENLLSNAVKFTPEGGHVTVDLDADGAFAELRVRNTGAGLGRETLSKVFAPFYQANEGVRSGLGLGLAIVAHLIELHGGHVTASSDGPGRGVLFTIKLPLTKAPLDAPH